MAGNAEKIIELDRQRMAAMAGKDVATLNRIIADDLIYTHSSARIDTKKTLIGAMESGQPSIRRWSRRRLSLRISAMRSC